MRIVKQHSPGPGRCLIVMLTILAWFSISNHCALGAVIVLGKKNSTSTMHCHGGQPSPGESGNEQTPCCKMLKAVTNSKVNTGASAINFVIREYPTSGLTAEISQPQTHTLGLDTGPPGW